MTAINTSISYQSQFPSPSTSLNNMRTKSGAQSQMELLKGIDLKPVSPKYQVQNVAPLGELGKHVNLRA
jgi:hypothetical protein